MRTPEGRTPPIRTWFETVACGCGGKAGVGVAIVWFSDSMPWPVLSVKAALSWRFSRLFDSSETILSVCFGRIDA